MKTSTLLAKLEMLGVEASYSRPRVSNDNPYEGFKSLQEERVWVMQFVNWYNNEHRHSSIKFLTPTQRHNGESTPIMEKRKRVYESAKSLYPERWAHNIRNWDLPNAVALNPTDEIKSSP